ncbi:MAG TPA: ferredoxin family protein [Spirochaetota bacterium]|nr:ferredoxin family protein [Spirochaetota bacterium]
MKSFIEETGVKDPERVVIETECCKGCELCIAACPRDVLEMSEDFNRSGYHYSVFENREKCNSCTFCAIICPDMCIEVYR